MLRLYRHWLLLALMASVACVAGCSAIASYYAGEAGPVADGSTPDASFDARAQPPLDGPLDGAVTDQLEDLPSAEPSATDTTGDRSKVTIVDTLADMPRPPDDAGSVSGFVVCGGANNAWCQPTQRPTTYALRGIWGRSARDVYAVGDAGTILHYDGSSWTPMPSGVGVQLNAVFGVGNKVYAVGNSGTILELDTTNSWQSMDPAAASSVSGEAAARSAFTSTHLTWAASL